MVTFYKNGIDFYNDNKEIIDNKEIEMPFFKSNSLSIDTFDCYNYCIKISHDNKYILCVSKYPYNVLIYGDVELVSELANIIFISNLKFKQILAFDEIAMKFIDEYNKLIDYKFTINESMDLMICDCKNTINSCCEKPTKYDIDEIKELTNQFYLEVFGQEHFENVNLSDYYVLKIDNHIASICRKTRELDVTASISMVYTRPEYRNHGYSQQVVATCVNDIIDGGKKALLFVDQHNPISNHVYEKIGFKKVHSFLEIHKTPGNIKKTILAGGCFWCISDSFYEIDGVIDVYSGYSLGNTFFPTYEEVKSQITHHKESIYVIYDSSKIKYETLINIYFENIDPFDGEGQYIDRGESYQTGVITSCPKEIEYFYKVKECLESKYNKEVKVKLYPDTVFYIAEEYHQKYSIKNPEQFKAEMIESGRLKKTNL